MERGSLLDGGFPMSSSLRLRARRFADAIFSSISFGGLFGTWVMLTGLVAYKKGYPAIGYSVAVYLALWLVVAISGWLLEDRSASK